MTILFDEAIRQLLTDYASLQAEHQRLIASVPDGASYEAHTVRLYKHVCRVQFVLEQLRQKLNSGRVCGQSPHVRYRTSPSPR
jgi:hypothetical protein